MLTSLQNKFRQWKQDRKLQQWIRNGRPAPPPHPIKQAAIRDHAQRFGAKILVETGTYLGDMVEAMKSDFDYVYSIELSDDLYQRACQRFENDDHVHLLHGDSGQQIGNVIPHLDAPTLFWLDGHYSAGETAQGEQDTPIWQELQHILDAPDLGHVLLIDDARLFGTDPGYPTVDELREFLLARRPNLDFAIEDDSIRVTPAAVAGELPLKKSA